MVDFTSLKVLYIVGTCTIVRLYFSNLSIIKCPSLNVNIKLPKESISKRQKWWRERWWSGRRRSSSWRRTTQRVTWPTPPVTSPQTRNLPPWWSSAHTRGNKIWTIFSAKLCYSLSSQLNESHSDQLSSIFICVKWKATDNKRLLII